MERPRFEPLLGAQPKGLSCALEAEKAYPVERQEVLEGKTVDQYGIERRTVSTHYFWNEPGRQASFRSCMEREASQ